jgi:DNA-binding LacI/PurR family transcriptional regulator
MDLSTIRQPVADQAVDITTRLLATLANPLGEIAGDVVLPTELVVRGSTDPSRTVY